MTKTILILVANPQETTRLRLDKEVKEIRAIIKSSKLRKQLNLQDRGAIQPEDFQQELLDVNPQILHFCGHSSDGGLIVEDKNGSATTVTPEALASLLKILAGRSSKSTKIECVILNSCYSEDIARAISLHVEFVIGTHQQISDDAAIEFSKGFYRGLGAGESFETAFRLGCNTLELKQIPEHLTPVLVQNGNILVGGTPVAPKSIDATTSINVFNSPRGQVLWRLAYSFLRLDQLASGGWGKTLYHWMEMVWKGDNGTISRSTETRFNGGTDLTTYAFCNYCLFLEKSLQSPDKIRALMEKNEVAARVYENFTKRVGYQGAVGSQRSLRAGAASEVRLRHTLMGLISLLLYGKINQYQHIKDVLANICRYLVNNIPEWEHDESHLFAMVAAAVKLKNMLSPDIPQGQLEPAQVDALQVALAKYIPDMLAAANRPLNYAPQPSDTISGPLRGAIFQPYGNFWRMERSNFLMHFPGLVTDDGQSFLPEVSGSLKQRCAQIFSELLEEIELTSADKAPCRQLIRYHRKPKRGTDNDLDAPRDWSLSAELAVLLQMKAVRDLLSTYPDYDKKQDALNKTLLETFDNYNEHPEIFEFAHGAAFGRALQLFDMKDVKPEEVEKLDEAICDLCAEGVTERGLARLIRDHIVLASPEAVMIESRALRDLLITKLESGEYTPDIRMGKYAPSKRVCDEKDWAQVVQTVVGDSTIAFYDSDLSDKHIERYVSAPRLNQIYEIKYLFEQSHKKKGAALDVGCGAGQYAELLAKLGFEVKLLDASRKMLEMASARLKIPPVEPINIFDNSWRYPEASFDLIFASAIMIHVPQEKRDHIYANFRRLLKPDGILFVNYKIGDHTLISEDGRFFAYYRDDSQPQRELEDNGFQIRTEILDSNYKDMYQKPKLIRWAHFFCNKK